MRKLIGVFLLFFMTLSYAENVLYPFAEAQEETRFYELTRQMRCLVCQNQTLEDSNAPLASDLRQQIYNQIIAGASNEEIINYLEKRYGDYVNYRPPFNAATGLLWITPFLCLFLMIGGMLFYIKLRRKS